MKGLHKELQREDVWTEDTQLVLKHLSDVVAQHQRFEGRLEVERLGIFGHSMGGKVAVRLCQRVKTAQACLNEHGGLFNADAQSITVVPFYRPGPEHLRTAIQYPREVHHSSSARRGPAPTNCTMAAEEGRRALCVSRCRTGPRRTSPTSTSQVFAGGIFVA